MNITNQVNSQHLKGKIIIVTGANAGLGYETTKVLAQKGAHIIMACRSVEKAEKAKTRILQDTSGAKLQIIPLDLGKLSSVRTFAVAFLNQYDRLDILINNAGVMMPPYSKTEDGFESQMAANYFGHFLLTGLLLSTINTTPNARIVSLSSIAHKSAKINFEDIHWEKSYSKMAAYGQSKLACLMYSDELHRRLTQARQKTISVAAHPGASNTELGRHFNQTLVKIMEATILPLFTHQPDQGALPTLMAAIDPSVKGGTYYGPKGFNEMRGKPGLAVQTKYSRDTDIARRLWEVSEKLTGFKYEF